MTETLEHVLHLIRQRRAELTQAKQRLEIEDRELATAERVLVKLHQGDPPGLGEGPVTPAVAEVIAPVQPAMAGITDVPMRWKPERGNEPITPKSYLAPPPPEPEREMVLGINLEPLTPAHADLFRALAKLREEKGAVWLTYREVEQTAGVSNGNAYAGLKALQGMGYVKNFGGLGSPDWWPMATGQIKIRKKRGEAGDATVDEAEAGAAHGLNNLTAEQIRRGMGIDAAMEALADPEPLRPLADVVEDLHGVERDDRLGAPPLADDEEPTDMDSLSKSQREVLCVIVELTEDGGSVTDGEILALAELDRGRLEGVLTRLDVLGCIRMDSNAPRRWVATPLGHTIAIAIKADEA